MRFFWHDGCCLVPLKTQWGISWDKILGSSVLKLLSSMSNFLPTNLFLTARAVSSGRGKKYFWCICIYCCDLKWWRTVLQVVESILVLIYAWPVITEEKLEDSLMGTNPLCLELSDAFPSNTVLNSSCYTDKVHYWPAICHLYNGAKIHSILCIGHAERKRWSGINLVSKTLLSVILLV